MTIEVRGLTPLLQVFDMPTSIAFYRDLLGFELVTESGGDWAWLRLGGADLMLNTAYESPARPPAPDPARVAAHADTELYFACPDVGAAYALLHARSAAVNEPIVRDYGMIQLRITDPDGYELCFQWKATTAGAPGT